VRPAASPVVKAFSVPPAFATAFMKGWLFATSVPKPIMYVTTFWLPCTSVGRRSVWFMYAVSVSRQRPEVG
jgi:hypothetical protein